MADLKMKDVTNVLASLLGTYKIPVSDGADEAAVAELSTLLEYIAAAMGGSVLIASKTGVNLNATGDTTMTLSAFATGKFFVVDYVLATNASTALTTAVVGVFSGAAGSGQEYRGSSTMEDLATARSWAVPSFGQNTVMGTFHAGTMLNTAPIVNVATPEGAPATADFYVFGRTRLFG